MTAFADSIEALAGSYNPGIRGWALQVLAKVFEYRWRLRRERSKVVDRFIRAGCQTRSRHVVAENSTIHDLREKSGLRNEFAHQVWDIFLAFRRKCFLVASPAAKGDDHNFFSCRRG